MNNSYAVLKKNTFDIIDADSSFYKFLGKREYVAFDRIIGESYVEQFYRFMRLFQIAQEETQGNAIAKKFFIRLQDEAEKNHPFICWFSSGVSEDTIVINLIEVNELISMNDSFQEKLVMRDTILSLYNDTYFEYNSKDNIAHFFYITKGEHVICDRDADDLNEKIKENVDREFYEDLDNFLLGMKNGERQLSIHIPCDVTDKDKKGIHSVIQAAAIYEKGELVRYAGYLHRGECSNTVSNKKVEIDSLTGVLTKAEITGRAINIIDLQKTKNITICIIDVDYFKNVNDKYGHLIGDEVLQKVAGAIEEAVGNAGSVGRIGGDEFMVIFYNAYDMENMRDNLKSIKNHVRTLFPSGIENYPAVTLSMGCAAYPKDAGSYLEVFRLADFALYRAKEKGRDRYIIYDVEKHGELLEKAQNEREDRIEGRGNLSMGDILCAMADRVFQGKDYPIQKLLDDFVVNFEIPRVIIYAGEGLQVKHMAGAGQLTQEIKESTQHYVNLPDYEELYEGKMEFAKNDILSVKDKHPEIYEAMLKQKVASVVQIKIKDSNGNLAILSIEAIDKRTPWNKTHFAYYRLFAALLEKFNLS